MKGFFNKLLRIDLTGRSHSLEEIPDEVLRSTLGGKGLGVHYLLAENPPGVDALSPDNRFILVTGPATGTRMWGQSRFAAFTKSPATGGFAESYCGGTLAPKIKGCGIDMVILQGRCSEATFVTVEEGGVRFEQAAPLEGMETHHAERYILAHSRPDAGALVVGPAGERGVVFACVKSDRWRSLGRCGLGAVLGSKNVKGISFAGSALAEIADEALLGRLIRSIAREGRQSPVSEVYQRYGTPSQVAVTNSHNCFPTRYWQSGHFEKWHSLSAEYMLEHFDVARHGCPSCFLQCTKRTRVRAGRHAGLEIEGPEYETIYALGGLNCIEPLEEVAYLNDLCDRLGLDTMSAGNIAAFAVEAYRRGKIDFPIAYDQPDRVAELLQLIAEGRGVGALLGRGIRAASEELGLEELAVHVKGLEPAGFDPRVLKGMGLSYATAARGACHLRGTFYKAELSGQIEKERTAGKARLYVDYEDRAALFDSLILCRFFRDFVLWDELATVIEATTGMKLSRAQLELLANRITQRSRAYNRREGLEEACDTLPPRLLREGTAQGARLSREELACMIGEYDSIRRSRDEQEATGLGV
jgi:aldehyde:ferredoxin oxidoreductase